jgi:hypothetical protein
MSTLLASFEAARHPRLPASARVILSARDFQIIDWLTSDSPRLIQRTAVLYDGDRDERVLDLLTAAHYREPWIFSSLIGIAESKGDVSVYYGHQFGTAADVPSVARAFEDAAKRAIVSDKWEINVVLVPVHNGVLDRTDMPRDAVLSAAPSRFQLGLVEVHS